MNDGLLPTSTGDEGAAIGAEELGAADGGWYVDTRCTNCDVARQLAPELIREVAGRSEMIRQPRNRAEARRLHAAAFACPVRSIRCLSSQMKRM
jgi:hypothetical protein